MVIIILALQGAKQRSGWSTLSSYDLMEAMSKQVVVTQKLSRNSKGVLVPAGPLLSFPRGLILILGKGSALWLHLLPAQLPAEAVMTLAGQRILTLAPPSIPVVLPLFYYLELLFSGEDLGKLMFRACA